MQKNNIMWRCLFTLLLALGGVYTSEATDISGNANNVYVNTTGSYTLLNNSNLTFTVITNYTNYLNPGTVSVKPSSTASFAGSLTIPSCIYVYSNNKYQRYNVTTIGEDAFKGKTGITDLYFSRDYVYGYNLTTIGANAFAGTTGLTGTIQLPRTITSIGDNAFALTSGSVNIETVVVGANNTSPSSLSFGKDIFANRTIANLHILGNFAAKATYTSDQTFNNKNVTNLFFYGDGTTSSSTTGLGSEGYYKFLTTMRNKNSSFGQLAQNVYIPGDDIINFVKLSKKNSIDLPTTVNCLTFDVTTAEGTYTLMLASGNTSDGGYQLALHRTKLNETTQNLSLDFSSSSWDLDIMPTSTGNYGHVVQIDSKAFADNNNLQSIKITPYSSTVSCQIQGNAFQGAKSLRYLDLSNENLTMASNYTLSRVPTTKDDESMAYKYTKATDSYDYELSTTTPFGGMPAYTLVFLPQSITSYPTATSTTETVFKYDGTTTTSWKRPVDENYMLYNSTNSYWQCNNFGVYDVPELNPTTVSGQSYTWYSFSTPYDIHVLKKSNFYRQFSANVPSSVCLPFAPDKPANATFYTFSSSDNTSVTLTSVDAPAANTPYFIRPTADTQLTSTKAQTISSSATISNTDNMHGVYTGQSMENISNAYGMSAKAFTTSNGTTYPAGTFFKLKQSANTFINPFRAYLTLSGAGAKASIMRLVIDDSTTGIKKTTADNDKATPYYNLQGIETAHPKKGIYIHNGRKVLIP